MDARSDSTGTTLATYVYLLHRGGLRPGDPAVAAACAAVDAGGEASTLASALHAAVRVRVEGNDPASVSGGLRALFGDAVRADFAGEGAGSERLAAAGRATFGDSRPWLAWIADRRDGVLGEHVVLVERLADVVVLMDPNPWDDVPEERALPVAEFGVRWDLAGGRCLRVA